ncbi:DMT family transporter [Streptomyces pratensis]|uniref:DMT family transporter n=1 Tax=Streptomyces pratensis TaxID=1169025 RepID=UPI0030174B7F
MPNTTSARAAAGGISLGIFANLTWGLAVLAPVVLSAFDPAAITLGRYLFYGVLSLVLALVLRVRLLGHSAATWRSAVLFAVAGNVGYYFFMVQGIALAGAPAPVVVIGTLPITVALYGNYRRREYPFRRLAVPIGLIGCGLVVVNVVEAGWSVVSDHSLMEQALGTGCALVALTLWTWYSVANAEFMKTHPRISSSEWSTLVGVATLVLSVLCSPLLLLHSDGVTLSADAVWWHLALGSLVLGVLVTWFGTVLWNRSSTLLPVTVAGQLIVFQTVSGLGYVFLATWTVPPAAEIAGIALVIVGVLAGLRLADPPVSGGPGAGAGPGLGAERIPSGRLDPEPDPR